MKNYKFKVIIFLAVLFFFFYCTDREKNNPLDPDATGNPDIQLSVLSYNNRIELYWNKLDLTDFKGFNVYRKSHPDSAFQLYVSLMIPYQTNFVDFNIVHNVRHSYYITIVGETSESAPSNQVSITPGLGYNWIVDKWGYQVVKTTYDAQYQIDKYYTDWPPEDIAIDTENRVAIIIFPAAGRIDIISIDSMEMLNTWNRNDRAYIGNPYRVELEPNTHMFWISDSGGSVYGISASDFSIDLITLEILKPGELFIDKNNQVINIINDKSNFIYQYSINGHFIERFSQIGNVQFNSPKQFEVDPNDNQFWLINEKNDIDYLYAGFVDNLQISVVDSFEIIYDFDINHVNQKIFIAVSENDSSKILQLSKAGIRQSELTGFINPRNVTHNPYDGTLLVTDSGNGRIIHFDEYFDILGIFTNLNFPIKLKVE